jgi:DNA helicase-2/ATP-dependent DNA helicase PcrA
MTPFGSSYSTPGWQRAQARQNAGGGFGASQWAQAADIADEDSRGGFSDGSSGRWGDRGASQSRYNEGFGSSTRGARKGPGGRTGPMLIEGEILAKSTGAPSPYDTGSRVLHLKFGPGTVAGIDGNKLTVDFDKAGRKMVLDSFVQPAG